jgi:hypothetical protein
MDNDKSYPADHTWEPRPCGCYPGPAVWCPVMAWTGERPDSVLDVDDCECECHEKEPK